MLVLLVRFWREVTIVGLSLALVAMYHLWPAPIVKTETVTKTVYVKQDQKSKITVTKPNGSTIVKETETINSTTTADKVVDSKPASPYDVPRGAQYGIGATVDLNRSVNVIGTAKLGNSPLDAIIEFNIKNKQLSAGILYRF